jgi:diketogulonate reductase-like aldo/keto reductase
MAWDSPRPLSRRALLGLMATRALAGRRAAAAERPLLARPIPSTGEALPAVGLGTWRTFDVGPGAAERGPLAEVLRRFVALGGRVVDTSPMYGHAESAVGDLAAEAGLHRSLFLATKVWTSGREPGIAQMERSLRRLRAERLDLIQVHNLVDWRTHLATFGDWKRQGRVRYAGVTHYTAEGQAELERVLRTEPVDALQVNYSPAEPEAERRLLPLAQDRGVAVVVNRPFAEGALLGRLRGRPLPGWAAELGCRSWAQAILKWILADPAVTCVVPATSRAEHVADNLGAAREPLPDAALRRRILTDLGLG